MASEFDKSSLILIQSSLKLLTYQFRLYFDKFKTLSESLSIYGIIFISVFEELMWEIFIPSVWID